MQCHGLQCGFCTPGMLMTDPGAARPRPRPDRGHDPRGHLRPDLPVHRLHHHRPLGAVGRGQGARGQGRPGRERHRVSGERVMTTTDAREDLEKVDNDQTPVGPRPDAPQGGPALHPRHGQVRRRHQAARHAAPRDPAVAGRARPDRQHRHQRRAGAPQGQGRHHRRRPRRAGARLDAHALERRAGRARHRQGPVPAPGGRVRRGRGPLRRPRRARADRRRVRAAAAGGRRTQGAGAGRAGDPRRPRGQDRQPLLRLGDRRRGGHRGGVRERRRGRGAGHRLPAGAPGADGDLRLRRRLRAGERQAHALDDQPGPARAPHGLRAGVRAARAQDPGDLARHRRRLRQQGPDLPRATSARSSRPW